MVIKRTKSLKLTNYIIHILVFLIIVVIIFPFYWSSQEGTISSSSFMKVIGLIPLLLIIVCFISWKQLGNGLSSMYYIFLISFYVFSNGELLLFSLGIPLEQLIAFGFNGFTNSDFIKAGLFNSLSICTFHIGAIIAHSRTKNKWNEYKTTESISDPINRSAVRKVAWFLIFISLPFDIYYTLLYFFISKNSGYLALSDSNIINVNSTISSLYLYTIPGFLLLVSTNKPQKVYKSLPLIYLVIKGILLTIAGQRGAGISLLIVVLWFTLTQVSSIKKSTFFKVILLSYFLLISMRTSVIYRNSTNKSIASFIGIYFSSLLNTKSITSMFNEFGSTIRPLLELFRLSNFFTYKHGMTYIYSFIYVIPSFIRSSFNLEAYGKENVLIEISQWLDKTVGVNWGLGYSLQAESYYNFGNYGWIFMIVFGFMITIIIQPKVKSKDDYIINTAISASMLNLFLIFARSTSYILAKEIIYYYFIPILLIKFIRTQIIKKNNVKI